MKEKDADTLNALSSDFNFIYTIPNADVVGNRSDRHDLHEYGTALNLNGTI